MPQPRKSVSFCDKVKPHDGILARQAKFERLIANFFISGMEISEFEIFDICAWEAMAALELMTDTLDLITRLSERKRDVDLGHAKEDYVPVLPRGGGKAFRVYAKEHLHCLKCLHRVIHVASTRLSEAQNVSVNETTVPDDSNKRMRIVNCT